MVGNIPWSKPGRFYRGNLHCHSTLTDGTMALPDVVAAYRHQGYDFVSVTDHFVVADTRPFRTETFTTLLGTELHDESSAISSIICINAIGVSPEFTAVRGRESVLNAGAIPIAVTGGYRPASALRAAGATLAVDDLATLAAMISPLPPSKNGAGVL